MIDERCVICGETEDGNAEHDGIPTGVHSFLPPSKLHPLADKATMLPGLYWYTTTEATVVRVYVGGFVDFLGTDEQRELSELSGAFYGPIEVPSFQRQRAGEP